MGTTVWTFLRAGKLYITDRRGPSTNVSYFHYRSELVSCCFADSTCHQPVMAASELAAMRNLSTCELDKRRHLVTDVRTSKPYLGQEVKLCEKYLGQRPIKVKRSTCQRSGMNARMPLLPETHLWTTWWRTFELASDTWRHLPVWSPGVASWKCDVTVWRQRQIPTFCSYL